MKKYILVMMGFVFMLAVPFLLKAATSDSFQLMDFPDSFTAPVGDSLSTYINFLYSGSFDSGVGVSILGKAGSCPGTLSGDTFPCGVELGSIENNANGLDNITYSGVPTTVGDYSYNLELTDNNGAILIKPFVFHVVKDFSFNNTTLSDATINQLYSQEVYYTYSSTTKRGISYSNFPDSFYQTSLGDNNYGTDNSFRIQFFPTKTGQFNFSGSVRINDVVVATTIFTVNVVNPNQEVSAPVQVQAPVIATTTVPVMVNTPNTSSIKIKPVNSNTPHLIASSTSEIQIASSSKVFTLNWYQRIWHFIKSLF